MSEVKPKWIIEDGRLVIGKCINHSDMAYDLSKVTGGSWWSMNYEGKHLLLYGSSSDFGYASLESVTIAIREGKCDYEMIEGHFNSWSFSYSTRYKLEDAERDAVAISKTIQE